MTLAHFAPLCSRQSGGRSAVPVGPILFDQHAIPELTSRALYLELNFGLYNQEYRSV